MSDSYMQPEVHEDQYYMIETSDGVEIIPLSVSGTAESIADLDEYLHGDIDNDKWYEMPDRFEGMMAAMERFMRRAEKAPTRHKRNRYLRIARRIEAEASTIDYMVIVPPLHSGWVYRMQAFGTMDITDWDAADTEAEAYEDLIDKYGDDYDSQDWVEDACMKAGLCTECQKVLPEDNKFGNQCSLKCSNQNMEEDGPDDDDYITDDYRVFRSHGKGTVLVTVPDGEDWEPHIQRHMEKEGYSPNVWYVDDHGGITLLSAWPVAE